MELVGLRKMFLILLSILELGEKLNVCPTMCQGLCQAIYVCYVVPFPEQSR